ncbi:MAG: tetratricopeptide repeat protein [Candidatus Krumholzibacteriota bacterium]|nr:tetratricopeptide repeat protein [Candidatus Krumholzibacteriota bacterium]
MSKATQLRQKAQAFLKKGKVDKAIEEYKKLLTVESRNPNLYNELGDIYLRTGEKVLAVTSFEKAAENYEKVALYNNAVAVCKKILRTVPNRIETIYKLGEIKAKQKFMGEAETFFMQYFDLIVAGNDSKGGKIEEKVKNILDLSPDCEGIWSKAAEVYAESGLKSQAATILAELIAKNSLKGDPQRLNYYRNRLDLIKQSLKHEEIEKINEIISPSQAPPVTAQGVDTTGIDITGNAVASARDNDDSVAGAEAVERAGQAGHDEAGKEPDVSTGPLPKSGDEMGEDDLKEDLQGGSHESGDIAAEGGEEAVEEEAIDSRPVEEWEIPSSEEDIEGGGRSAATLAEDLSDIIEQEDAEIENEASVRNIVEDITSDVEEDDFKSHYDLGMAYIEMGLFDDALKELQISSRSEQLQLQSLEMIGQCFIEINNPRLAVKQLQRGLELTGMANGDNLGIHYNLGLAHEALGEMDKAREHFEEVYIVDVTFRDISEKMKKFSTIS